jgi:murein DD-endopeptidase MepM/ murein hydrolase activator NlpD
MQIMITHGASVSKTHTLHFTRWQLLAVLLLVPAALVLTSGAVYSYFVLKATREGWPIVSTLVAPIVQGEFAQRDRYMRQNLDAMALKVGEMQAKLVKLESLGERVSTQVGVKPLAPGAVERGPQWPPAGRDTGRDGTRPTRSKDDAPRTPSPGARGQGGPYVALSEPNLESLNDALDGLERSTDWHGDVLRLVESRLHEGRLAQRLVPSMAPVDVQAGSGFGFRNDPFSGQPALHSGLDFPADVGVPVVAAAGGVVVSTESTPTYGHTIDVDHGNRLVTRYAHLSKVLVQTGAIVQRGQPIGAVGNSGRSTGPHLHFEVLVDEVPQDPARFLGLRRP